MIRIIPILGVFAMVAGCNQHSSSTGAPSVAVKTTPAVFNSSGAPVVEFNAPDMMCPEGCGVKVKEILSGQPGVKEVVVDFESKTATVAIEDGGKFDSNAAVAELVDHGFKNSSLKLAAASKPVPDPPSAKGDAVQ